MKNILPALALIFLSTFAFSGCDLFQNPASKEDASTQTPVVQEEISPSPSPDEVNPEQESVESVQSDQELLQLLENMEDPSFGDDLDTLESGLR
jgi:PBP1b-binding outer membrane lipoprotein LpoB